MHFSILDYGATTDGTLCTSAIQRAIDACFLAGGGEVVIPAGVFHTGGIRLRSNITLHLLSGAVLKGSRNPEDYFGYLHDALEPLPAEAVEWRAFERPLALPELPWYTVPLA